MVNLREHQQRALDNAKEIFEEDNKAIVVQPTGVGKTYIALKLFEENKDKKLTFVAPSQAIIWELKVKIAKEYGVKPEEYKKVFKNLELTTYQQINVDMKKNEKYIDNFDSDYVVFDEAHHIGSDKWGTNAIELMEGHPETKFLGLTATPERTDGIDVVKDVFGGNLADEMSLEEAVADRLLKMPNYINAIYSYKPIVEELEDRIESLKEINPEKYIMLKKDMQKAKNALEKADGMPEIFAKHIKEKNGRFIIFCKNIDHLKEMVKDSKSKGWFHGINKNVETLEIHSLEDDEQNRKILKRFKGDFEATEDTLRVLFSVEKINEGVHIDNLDGVIMLRPTKSKIIFRQQLGRVMSISKKANDGIVFDIVNNIDSFQEIHDFMNAVIERRKQQNLEKNPKEIEREVIEEFNITDETRAVRDILRKVAGGLETEWEECYQRSVRWREEHDGKAPCNSKCSKKERKIYDWEYSQKLKYIKKYQDAEEDDIPEEDRVKVNKLKSLGLEYVSIKYKTVEEHFESWKNWTLDNGITPSQRSKDETERKIANNMGSILKKMRREPKKHKEQLKEYEEIYAKYGRTKEDKTIENFETWKRWTLENKITPSRHSNDENEKSISNNMVYALQKIRREPEKYKQQLKEYEEIYAKYGRAKGDKTIENFEKWKMWTLENKITPINSSEDEVERKIACNMSNSLTIMKRKSEKYGEQLSEYEKIYSKYGRERNHKTREETFEIWKAWTLENGITPSCYAANQIERKTAVNMNATLQKMRGDKKQYKTILEEYEQIYSQYGRERNHKTREETFEIWKNWTLENDITPSQHSKDEIERKIAANMNSTLQKIKKNKEQYKDILKEYYELYAKYGRRKLKKLQEEKSELLEDVTKLKSEAKAAEKLDNETKNVVQKIIDEKAQKPEDIGE